MVKGSIDNSLYDKYPNLILGFHGCHLETFERVLYRHEHLKRSENDYDWLGHGIYFWENGYERAMEWAKVRYAEKARVIGAVIDLGYCLSLTDIRCTNVLKVGYSIMSTMYKSMGMKLPENKNGRSAVDVLLRNLDCAVIQQIHAYNEERGAEPYDSVRGVFSEGNAAYPGSAIPEKTHIQICVVNPNCIKGYFSPMPPEEGFRIP
ncbi:MAG: hypothetical protein IKI75_05645 [Lachnospiraceae bacterium]|nr:hypothetical protein [Lachnospiraceae bacterium]